MLKKYGLAFCYSTILGLFLMTATHLRAETQGIKIGVISGLSGAADKWNRFQNMGITLAQEELKAQGFPIELVIEDSSTSAPKAIAAYSKLFEFDKVDAILADDFGFVVAPLLPRVRQDKRFLVALSLPHARYCNQAPGYFYSMTSQFSQSGEAFDEFFKIHPEVKRIAMVVFDDPEWGNSYREIWARLAKKHQVEIVDVFLSNEWAPDFKSAFTKMLPKKPDAIFVAHEPVSFFKSIAQFKYKGLIVFANNVLEVLADSTKPRTDLDGVYVVDPVVTKEFHERFRARFGQPPILEAYAGYEGLMAVAKAFAIDRVNPASAMKSVSYQGVAGPVDFTKSSCAGNLAKWGLFKFEGGELAAVK